MPTEIQSITSLISSGGLVGLLTLILIGGYKRFWVFGWVYLDKVRECEEWRLIALRGMGNTATAVSALEITAKKAATP